MSNFSNDRSDLHSRLAAFIPSSLRPATIVIPTIDDEGTTQFFADHEPVSISAEEAHSHAASMWFFTVDAFVYYLYPFLHAVVASNAQDDVVCGHFLAQFPNCGDKERVDRGNRIIDRLAASQLDVLLDVVQLLALVYPDVSTFELTRRIRQRQEASCSFPKSDDGGTRNSESDDGGPQIRTRSECRGEDMSA